MIRSSGRGVVAAAAIGLAVHGAGLARSGAGDEGCARDRSIELHAVRSDPDCEGCRRVVVDSVLASGTEVTLGESPLLALNGCGLSRVFRGERGLLLLLSDEGLAAVDRIVGDEAWIAPRLLAATERGGDHVLSLLRAETLSRTIPLLDVDSPPEVERFLEAVGFPADRVEAVDTVPVEDL